MWKIISLDKDTTLRLKQKTKERLHSLDFVRKHSDDEILNCLIDLFKEVDRKDRTLAKKILEKRRARTQELKMRLKR